MSMIYMPNTTANLKEMATKEDGEVAAYMKRVWQARIFGQKASILPRKLREQALRGAVKIDVPEPPEPTTEEIGRFRETIKKAVS